MKPDITHISDIEIDGHPRRSWRTAGSTAVGLAAAAVGLLVGGVLIWTFVKENRALGTTNRTLRLLERDLPFFETSLRVHLGQLTPPEGLALLQRSLNMRADALDAWGHRFVVFVTHEGNFCLASRGPDGKLGTADDISVKIEFGASREADPKSRAVKAED